MKRKRGKQKRSKRTVFFLAPAILVIVLLFLLVVHSAFSLYSVIRIDRGGMRFKLPSVVYSEWTEVRAGDFLSPSHFEDRLKSSHYRKASSTTSLEKGEYSIAQGSAIVFTRSFQYPDGLHSAALYRIVFDDNKVLRVEDMEKHAPAAKVRIEPAILSVLADDPTRLQYWVPLQDIPPRVVNAVIATEDKNFFDHHGIDPFGILRALVTDLVKGSFEEGGSTITQQLVKNLFLTSKKTIGRKISETVLALIVEKKYTKEEILEAYLNLVYLGNTYGKNIHGVDAAARCYFGKPVAELSLAQAAMLAGIIRAPNYYSPLRQPERANAVKNIVLNQMKDREFISAVQHDSARKLKTSVQKKRPDLAPYFATYVGQMLRKKFSAGELTGNGLKIFTTLDPALQSVAEKSAAAELGELRKSFPGSPSLQMAIVSLDPQNGDIRCMIGGRDFAESEFNRAVQAKRQVGSAVKPIIAAVALDAPYRHEWKTYTTVTMLNDRPVSYQYADQVWSPENHGDEYLGDITLRRAVARSQNVAMVRLLEDVRPDTVAKYVSKMDVDCKVPRDLTLALGTMEVSPLDMAKIYSVFASNGDLHNPRCIKHVTDKEGSLVFTETPSSRNVMNPATCYLVTDILKSVFVEGTAISYQGLALRYPIAGKTGTTNDYTDAWFAGYSPSLVTAVWVGDDKNKSIGLPASRVALPIWGKIMEYSLHNESRTEFSTPKDIEFARIDSATGLLATENCPEVSMEPFIRGTAPTVYCTLHGGQWNIVRNIKTFFWKRSQDRADSSVEVRTPAGTRKIRYSYPTR
ncbi:MAG: PBP1A family penicillin-binding protein [Candidatus Abyssobacteria bacterium SURF_17]|uniref:PBP1A family penicillin-binding protein n=1 Tax=Candidatus Abyssobacteria bacterium SURF_17 TaxID=2093361 RepID=A0A419ESY8_9BACT|nr:MAG: PBP1A family penicillin-binding protein [Candidatus Abyssubacteria bacterium SURF_17]